jgi:creatinine amidohydrolase
MATRRTVELGRMSFAEVAAVLPEKPIILLPIGTVEQHGPHLPNNADNMVASFVATRAAEQTNALVAPNINYGVSPYFLAFPGTISVRPDTLAQIVREVCQSLIEQGLSRIIFVNNHGGNEAALEQVARELKTQYGVLIGNIYPWGLGYQLMRDTYEDVAAAYGHGAEPETSAMMAMFPEDYVAELQESGVLQPAYGWTATGYNKVEVEGQPVPATLYLDSDELTTNGVTGDGSVATRERGEIWIERVVGFAVAFINQYDRLTKDAEWANRPPVRKLVGVK